MKISTKKIWISSSAWRGRETYQSASGGANDTGTWSDSPCPSNQREAEIKMFTDALKKEGIKYKTGWAKSSNVFCASQHVLVAKEDHEKAYAIAKEIEKETSLFYAENNY